MIKIICKTKKFVKHLVWKEESSTFAPAIEGDWGASRVSNGKGKSADEASLENPSGTPEPVQKKLPKKFGSKGKKFLPKKSSLRIIT